MPNPSCQLKAQLSELLIAQNQKLEEIQAEIDLIENNGIVTNTAKVTLRNLRGFAFNIQDLMADCEYQMFKLDHQLGQDSHDTDAVVDSVACKWKEIKKIFESVKQYYDSQMKLRNVLMIHKPDAQFHNQENTSFTGSIPSVIFGRDDDMTAIKDIVDGDDITDSEEIRDDQCETEMKILYVLGPPGIGKTSIIQHVYCNFKRRDPSDRTGWVFVPESFDALKLITAVNESLNLTTQKHDDDQRSGTKLLVLDGVCHDDKAFWEKFWNDKGLEKLLKGSVVIIIIRDYNVKESMPDRVKQLNWDIYVLKPLEDSYSREMLKYLVPEDLHGELERNAEELCKKCKGIPSALKMASILFKNSFGKRSTRTLENRALQGEIWNLKASYRRLAAPQKRCVSYCFLFFENDIFTKDFLIRLWIAEGFIQKESNKDLEVTASMYFDDFRSRCFFIKSDYGDADDQFVMPLVLQHSPEYYSKFNTASKADLSNVSSIRHLALVAQKESLPIMKNFQHESLLEEANRLRTFLVIYPGIEEVLNGPFPQFKIDLAALPTMKFLRTLDLSFTYLTELPDFIGMHLFHLRFLGLNGTRIQFLPESICKLYNLQTLQLKSCTKLEEMPKGIGNMTNLRHLDTGDITFCMPSGIGKLTELQSLDRFNVGRSCGMATVKELEKLQKLQELHMSGICNVETVNDCVLADLKGKLSLISLTLSWLPYTTELEQEEIIQMDILEDEYEVEVESKCEVESEVESEGESEDEKNVVLRLLGHAIRRSISYLFSLFPRRKKKEYLNLEISNEDIQDSEVKLEDEVKENEEEVISKGGVKDIDDHIDSDSTSCVTVREQHSNHSKQILESLEPHDNIKILVIKSFGDGFPKWIGNDSLNVTAVRVENCRNCDFLPSFGRLPKLCYLRFKNLGIKCIGPEFCYGSEEQLEEDRSYFQQLEEASFESLPELKEWSGVRAVDFPKIQMITFFNCCKLENIPSFLKLKTLEIENCSQLKDLPEFSELESLKLVNCDRLTSLENLHSLNDLTVMYCDAIELLGELPNLESLWLEDCKQLEYYHPSIENLDEASLYVQNCPLMKFSAPS